MIDKTTRSSIYYLWTKVGCDTVPYKQFRRRVAGRWLVYLNGSYEMGIYRASSAIQAIAEALDDAGYPRAAAALSQCESMTDFQDRYCSSHNSLESFEEYDWIPYGLRAVQL